MYKNQRGITIISLAVTVIVILIISVIGISATSSIISTARFQEVATNMSLILTKAKAEAEMHNFDDTNHLTGTPADSGTLSILDGLPVTYLDGEPMPYTNLVYVLSQEDLNDMGLKNLRLKNGQYFAVDYGNLKLVEVYYLPNGFSYKGRTYYKLSEIQQINVNEEI